MSIKTSLKSVESNNLTLYYFVSSTVSQWLWNFATGSFWRSLCVSFCKDGFGSGSFIGGCSGTDYGSGSGGGIACGCGSSNGTGCGDNCSGGTACGWGSECGSGGGTSCGLGGGCNSVLDCMIADGIGATDGGLINKQGLIKCLFCNGTWFEPTIHIWHWLSVMYFTVWPYFSQLLFFPWIRTNVPTLIGESSLVDTWFWIRSWLCSCCCWWCLLTASNQSTCNF